MKTSHSVVGESFFNELFILEIANNHLGSVKRGTAIIERYAEIVKANAVRAAIKFQFRDVDTFIHTTFRQRRDIRYIKKTMDTRLSENDYSHMIALTRELGLLVGATPFDEPSVEQCERHGCDFIKLASSGINDWPLIERITKAGIPIVASCGGASLEDIDHAMGQLTLSSLPIALMHCVSLYPTKDHDLQLNQIDFLRNRYPEASIGFSSHEFANWNNSMQIAYAKGARVFERHVDINDDGVVISPYCSLPFQIDTWFKSFHKARELCGETGTVKHSNPQAEINYLDLLVRGLYARRDLEKGSPLTPTDVYLAIPLQRTQLSCRESAPGQVVPVAAKPLKAHQPILLSDVVAPFSPEARQRILNRGIG